MPRFGSPSGPWQERPFGLSLLFCKLSTLPQRIVGWHIKAAMLKRARATRNGLRKRPFCSTVQREALCFFNGRQIDTDPS